MALETRHPRVAVIGQGAREHALVWKLAQSPLEPELYAVPGNPGMWQLAKRVDIASSDMERIVVWAREAGIDLVVVGPEGPLADGLVDALTDAGIPAFGPSREAAQLEASKAFSKALMRDANVPTARFGVFTEVDKALGFMRTLGIPVVVKADGLAAGKGVVVAQSWADAEAAVRDMLEGNRFGLSGSRVVIEEYLSGMEVSCMYFVDASAVVPMLPARDFKRAYDGDEGPNTGGMGAFAPVPSVTDAVIDRVTKTIVQPVVKALRDRGITYRGVLYAGLMITDDGPKVIEFNARFGDPETEVVLPLLATDLLQIAWAVAHDELSTLAIEWRSDAAVCVVVAGGDYPAGSDHGTPIALPTEAAAGHVAGRDGEVVFHAGTALRDDGQLVTAGGRVLTISAIATDIPAAIAAAYSAAETVQFERMHYRRDIAHNWRV
ncbi:phosphoribosylamine--glycine ligase [Alicyclobacillus acidiphilus]|uniref:phosphoribosylamine--glycine ligase n=1 Tax=Alicyclobacillus acidiphilus TaxID=182455 RepID=UPI00082E98AC|nr:phosphoribosylamine--glycine ligase [Alicyclobacillus acidiphilus]